ncbi:MAG: lytic transglycosylase domain-containing protein [Firmicutes bacterium]|nr:lytic transglycosylase domain-containing protein [Bacillota bacterium]
MHWRTVFAGVGRLVRGVLRAAVYLVASPAVLLADLVQPQPGLDRGWVLGFIGFSLLFIGLTWGLGYVVTLETLGGNALVNGYAELSRDLENVPYLETIQTVAAENGLDPALVAAIVAQESRFDPLAVSRAGAKGLMQIMPDTWRLLRPDSPCSGDHAPPACGKDCIFDPAANIRAGTRYFADLLREFEGNLVLAFAAYNAGAAVVRLHAGDRAELTQAGFDDLPPFAETRDYVRRVLALWVRLKSGSVPDLVTLSAEECLLVRQLASGLPVVVVALWILFGAWALRRLGLR